jgi:hypothetical protein
MKVLLLHPEDDFSRSQFARSWDLIVDLGRAPVSTYQDWSRRAGCRVVSLYDFAAELDATPHAKALLQLGLGQIVDQHGIDWWDVFSLLLVDDLLQFALVGKLAQEIGVGCDLYVSRPSPLAETLRRRTGGTLRTLERGSQPMVRAIRHYKEALANLDSTQLLQVLQDKFDPEHHLRRRFAARVQESRGPVTLLPSNYTNVSRMAVAYAAMLPEEPFLLVCARNAGKLKTLPANVRMMLLDSYFVSANRAETTSLLNRWNALKDYLVSSAEEFADADANGTFARIPIILRSGVAVRDAWIQVLERENVTGCLCADDTAPDSRIPLILAKNRGIPAIACHHGALDYRMAIKQHHADFYLAKGEMERDYLTRVCQVPPEKLVMGSPALFADPPLPNLRLSDASTLVFFTEPYQSDAWRSDEVYRDLLPRLCALAKTCGLRLVFKLHPFESIKSIRRLLQRYLPSSEEREIQVIAGLISAQLWKDTRFAMTVQSTVALECNARSIPVFLCAWLREPFSGYVKQYARFGVGCVLESAGEIAEIPSLLKKQNVEKLSHGARWQAIDCLTLQNLLRGSYSLSPKLEP